MTLCDPLENTHAESPQSAGTTHSASTHTPHPVKPSLILHASHANHEHVPRLLKPVQQLTEQPDIAQGERMQRRARQPTHTTPALTRQRRRPTHPQHQRRPQGVGARDEIHHAPLPGLAALGRPQRVDDHLELPAVRVGRQLDADAGHALVTGHAPPVRAHAVGDRAQVFGQAGRVVGRGRAAVDVGARQVHLHGQAEVLVHLGGVGDQGVGHGDLVGRARHRQDERLLRHGDRGAQVALADDLVDVAQVLRQREGGVAVGVERGQAGRRGQVGFRGRADAVVRFRVGYGDAGGFAGRACQRLAGVEEDVLVLGWVVREAFEK